MIQEATMSEDVFSSVQDEYNSEGLSLQDIKYQENIDM